MRTKKTSEAYLTKLYGSPTRQSYNTASSMKNYIASRGQLLVQVQYSGILPADLKHASIGITNVFAGYEYSGTVLTAPLGSHFSTGGRVAGTTPSGISRGFCCGTHQNPIIAEENVAFTVPSSMSMPDAAGLNIILRKAAIDLFNRLRLPFQYQSDQI